MADRRLGYSFSPLGYRAAIVGVVLFGTGCDPSTFNDNFEDPDTLRENWLIDTHPRCVLETSTATVREGDLALRVQAPEGLRCEVVPKIHTPLRAKFSREPFGRERWYNFSVFVEDPESAKEPKGLDDNAIVAQWHSSPDPFLAKESGRGPPLALRIYDGVWGITYGWDERLRSDSEYLANKWHWVGEVKTGRWIDWSFRVIWSYESDGVTEVWRDSELVMQRRGANTFNDFRGVYLKLGLYHPVSNQTIFLDRVSITNQP